MAKMHIERLSLEVPGISQSDGQRLAQLISSGLAAAVPSASATNIDRIRIDLPSGSGEDLDRLANRIVTEILHRLKRTL